MELQQLITFMHVAELGSVSRAADRLGIAQPALSRQIRSLEAELGTALFRRHGRGMVPNDVALRLLAPAGEILDRLADMRSLARSASDSLTGRVRIGMTPTVAEIMTVPVTTRLKAEHPDIALSISSAFSGHLLDWLKRGDLDCCVSYDPEISLSVRTQSILRETMMLVDASTSGLVDGVSVDFADVVRRPLVLPSSLHGLRRIVDECAARAGVTLAPAIEADSLSGIIDLVAAGLGATILPLAPVYRQVCAGQLAVAPIHDPTPSRNVVLAYPADRPIDPATRYVGATFASLATNLVETGVWAGQLLNGDPV